MAHETLACCGGGGGFLIFFAVLGLLGIVSTGISLAICRRLETDRLWLKGLLAFALTLLLTSILPFALWGARLDGLGWILFFAGVPAVIAATLAGRTAPDSENAQRET